MASITIRELANKLGLVALCRAGSAGAQGRGILALTDPADITPAQARTYRVFVVTATVPPAYGEVVGIRVNDPVDVRGVFVNMECGGVTLSVDLEHDPIIRNPTATTMREVWTAIDSAIQAAHGFPGSIDSSLFDTSGGTVRLYAVATGAAHYMQVTSAIPLFGLNDTTRHYGAGVSVLLNAMLAADAGVDIIIVSGASSEQFSVVLAGSPGVQAYVMAAEPTMYVYTWSGAKWAVR
jgi:hypothetical protein